MRIQSYEENQLAILRPRFPDWHIWFVRWTTVRRTTWHAMPAGETVSTINAHSPDELAWTIQQQP